MPTPADVNQQLQAKRGWRYYTGLILFVLSLILPLLALVIVPLLGLFYFLPESLRVGNQPGWGFYITVGADIVFIISFFVLGAEFWAKLRALFQYNARVVVEDQLHGRPTGIRRLVVDGDGVSAVT